MSYIDYSKTLVYSIEQTIAPNTRGRAGDKEAPDTCEAWAFTTTFSLKVGRY